MTDIQQHTERLSNKTIGEDEVLCDILSWAKNCPKWQQHALQHLYTGQELGEDDIKELTELCKCSEQSDTPPDPARPQTIKKTAKTVRIKSIHGVENVNALQSEKHLTFCKEGVTVVYGDNGSGKSGYVRILNSACRSRTPAMKIFSDVSKADSGEQKCVIDYIVGNENKSKNWTPETPSDEFLSKVSVFDSKAASVHVDKANNVAYKPFPLLVLERLADACQKIKDHINTDIEALENQTPKSISKTQCGSGTVVSKLLAELNEKTRAEKVQALATLSKEDKKHLKTLEDDISNDPLTMAQKLDKTARRLNEVNLKFNGLQNAVSDDKIAKLSKLGSKYATAREAAKTAANTLFKDYPLPNVGSEVWKKLWNAAKEYSEKHAYPDQPFPVASTDSRCVLCQHELDDIAVARLQSFEGFVKNTTKLEEERTEKAYQDALDKIRASDVSIKETSDIVDLLRDENEELAKLAHVSAIKNKWRLRAILHSNKQEAKEKPLPSAGNWPSEAISRHAEALLKRAVSLRTDDKSEERKQMHSQRDELKDREWLATVQEDVVAEIERRKKRKTLEKSLEDTKTHKITTKSSEIAEQLVTNALCERFRSEVSKFNAKGLEVELRKEKSEYGAPLFRIFLTNNKQEKVHTGEVLSEGEHRCVAIAAFLAELATSESNSAIVFDDPVSSLDHPYRERVAERLAEEGKHRQVIVFTHDIVFLSLLNDSCRKITTNFNCCAVARTTSSTGVVQPDPPLRAQAVQDVIKSMLEQLGNERVFYERGNQDKWEDTADKLLKRLRKTWERAVEKVVEPVLQRFSNEVKTAGLVKLTVLSEKDCEVMRDAFYRLSKTAHSDADAMNKPTPTPEEIQKEIDKLQGWFDNIKARQNKVGK